MWPLGTFAGDPVLRSAAGRSSRPLSIMVSCRRPRAPARSVLRPLSILEAFRLSLLLLPPARRLVPLGPRARGPPTADAAPSGVRRAALRTLGPPALPPPLVPPRGRDWAVIVGLPDGPLPLPCRPRVEHAGESHGCDRERPGEGVLEATSTRRSRLAQPSTVAVKQNSHLCEEDSKA